MYNGLIIEDDPELSEIIAAWCNECGIEKTHTCANGATAVELLQKTEYDIIILDHICRDVKASTSCVKCAARSSIIQL